MAQIIRLKRSTIQGSAPTTSDLSTGELAINVYDGKVFLRKSGSVDVVQELVTNNYTGSVQISGSVTATSFIGDGSGITGITIGSLATIKQAFEGTTWVVNHNLNTEAPLVQAYDQDDYQIIPQSIRINDENTVTIVFPTSVSGSAVVANGGNLVSGSVAAANVTGFDERVKTKLNFEGVFSGSNQISMSGDVTGFANATVIASIDGGDI
jgi:hypothetical protein